MHVRRYFYAHVYAKDGILWQNIRWRACWRGSSLLEAIIMPRNARTYLPLYSGPTLLPKTVARHCQVGLLADKRLHMNPHVWKVQLHSSPLCGLSVASSVRVNVVYNW